MQERAGTAWVDGHSLLGPVVGNFCMDLAVKKAKEAGVGWVVARGASQDFQGMERHIVPAQLI